MKITIITTKNGEIAGSILGNALLSQDELSDKATYPVARLMESNDLDSVTTGSYSGIEKNTDCDYYDVEVPEEFMNLEASELHEKLLKIINKKLKK